MSPPTPYRLVLSTCPDAESAERIAAALVNAGLAACVNIVPAIRSIYTWQGKLQKEEEYLLVIKTHLGRYAELQAAIIREHPYELPEIVCLAIETGLPDYLAWIGSSVHASP